MCIEGSERSMCIEGSERSREPAKLPRVPSGESALPASPGLHQNVLFCGRWVVPPLRYYRRDWRSRMGCVLPLPASRGPNAQRDRVPVSVCLHLQCTRNGHPMEHEAPFDCVILPVRRPLVSSTGPKFNRAFFALCPPFRRGGGWHHVRMRPVQAPRPRRRGKEEGYGATMPRPLCLGFSTHGERAVVLYHCCYWE